MRGRGSSVRNTHKTIRLLATWGLVLLIFINGAPPARAAIRARHTCIPVANIAKMMGHHPDCVNLIDGPTCTEESVRDDGCKDLRVRYFTSCGSVVYNEVEDPETNGSSAAAAALAAAGLAAVAGGTRTFSHCGYGARPAGWPCNAARPQPGGKAAPVGEATTPASASGSQQQQLLLQQPVYVCGGGSLRGMCVPAGSDAPEHEQCVESACEKGLCAMPVPVNEGGACEPPGSAPPPNECQQRVCRGGRCMLEPLPDTSPCGPPPGPCGEHHCMAGACVLAAEEDGVICGPSSACADQVCHNGKCVEERRPDGKLCWHVPGDCPRTCAAGKCVPCSCGPSYAFWAGRQWVPGFQWTPFAEDLSDNSYGGYFNLLAEELDIPPIQLPYDGEYDSASRYAAESAIVVCSRCRLNMALQPGANMVQDGAVLTGSVGLAASPVRGGTYVTLDVVMYPNLTHQHLLLGYHPWASVMPPPLTTPHRWGDLSGSRTGLYARPPPASSAVGGDRGDPSLGRGLLPQPMRHHSAWAFVRRRPAHWGFTTQEQVRSVFVGLHLLVASCARSSPLMTATSSSSSSGGSGGSGRSSSGGSSSSGSSSSAASGGTSGSGGGSGSGSTSGEKGGSSAGGATGSVQEEAGAGAGAGVGAGAGAGAGRVDSVADALGSKGGMGLRGRAAPGAGASRDADAAGKAGAAAPAGQGAEGAAGTQGAADQGAGASGRRTRFGATAPGA